MTKAVDTIERTMRTVSQVVAGAMLAYLADKGWDDIDWSIVWKTAAFAALVCVLTAVVGSKGGTSTSFLDRDGGS